MGTKSKPPDSNSHRYGNYDEFVQKEGKYIPSIYPAHVKVIDDDSALIEVNLEKGLSFENSDDGVKSLKLDGLDSLCPELKSCMIHLLLIAVNGKRKISTVCRWSGALRHFFSQISKNCDKPIAQITLPMFADYCRNKSANMQKNIRSPLLFLIRKTPLPGISTELTHYLCYSRAPKPKTTSDIQNTNMSETPFSIDETRHLLSTVDTLYINGVFNEQDACLWRLLISEALRPSQIRLLKVKDVHISKHLVRLDIPMVKQQGMAARDFLNPTTLSGSLSKAIILHLKFVKNIAGEKIPGDSPLFSVLREGSTTGNPTYQIANQPISISHQIQRTAALINVNMDGDEDVRLFSRRLKHTKLTHLAMNGAGINVLARAGFQTSTISLKHYINITEEVFKNYEEKMRDTHLLIESSFRGQIVSEKEYVNNENDVLGSDLDSRMGVCDATLCGVLAPYGCYVCPKFNAFKESDHQRVLDELLLKRASREGLDLPIEAVARDDYVIRAVKQVIKEVSKNAE